ncbi:uncharacterized protein PAN0_001c0186 [Moesziomyces antarcticus]|uniref:Uncharacterized protein n=1 Tax=Pseudozyma antarctica TaxID=84753 RepID=A0A5C3FFN9_PSEA2|nr:uncharacterized protein PAN0_001c0186 [Moesziomyces antarcticus]GAK61990.1 hypothetical protein PAN0_001c0186 [Moesziomyces antarcticus]SPO42515.1 uncharacterized protein PSANT_00198 [Moesziomyces antarcticus]
MSSADTASAKKAAGQLQKDQGQLQQSSELHQSGQTDFDQGQGMQNADNETGASGFSAVAGAKDVVKDKLEDRKDV